MGQGQGQIFIVNNVMKLSMKSGDNSTLRVLIGDWNEQGQVVARWSWAVSKRFVQVGLLHNCTMENPE